MVKCIVRMHYNGPNSLFEADFLHKLSKTPDHVCGIVPLHVP